MPSRPQFSTDDSVKIVAWWYELKDIHKVCWQYAKDKGIEISQWGFEAGRSSSVLLTDLRRLAQFRWSGRSCQANQRREWRKHWKGEEPGHKPCWNVNQSDVIWGKSVWRILCQSQNFYPNAYKSYKIHLTTELTNHHKKVRLNYNNFVLKCGWGGSYSESRKYKREAIEE